MANGKLPLLGGAEVLDLQAHVKDKKMRELLARLVDERNRAIDHVRLVSLSLLETSEVLAARFALTFLFGAGVIAGGIYLIGAGVVLLTHETWIARVVERMKQ